MRRLLLICILLIYTCFTSLVYAQLPEKSQALGMREAVDQLADEFHINFIYESNLLAGKKAIPGTWGLNEKGLETILLRLFEPHSIGFYKIDPKNYALFSRLDLVKNPGQGTPFKAAPIQKSNFSINGVIRDQWGKCLDYSSVHLLENDTLAIFGVIADSLGRYCFLGVKAGNYKLQVTRMGYQSFTSAVIHCLDSCKNMEFNVSLKEAPIRLGQVAVDRPRPVFDYRADRTIIAVEGNFTGAGFSVSELLQATAGLKMEDNQFSLQGKRGVVVMLDGNQVSLPNDQLFSLLRGIPIGSVSQVELIHAPSARYDAQGNAGVINIKMLGSQELGLVGNAESQFIVGKRIRFVQSAAINFSSEKINIIANYSYQKLKGETESSGEDFISGALPSSYRQLNNSNSSDRIYQGTFGATYHINRKNSIALKTTLLKKEGSMDFSRKFFLAAHQGLLSDSSISSLGQSLPSLTSQTYNFSSKHSFGTAKHQLVIAAQYTNYGSKINEYFNSSYLHPSKEASIGLTQQLTNNAAVHLGIFSAGLDYSIPLAIGHQLELGTKLNTTRSDSRVLFGYKDEQGNQFVDYSRSNSFIYSEQINSGYLNYLGRIGNLTDVQLGARTERTSYHTAAIAGDQVTKITYTQLFPNLLISHRLQKNVITFSYRKNLGRPSYQDLNPFITYFSPFHYATGNQFLKPEITHSLAIGFRKDKLIGLTLGYSKTSNYLATLLVLNEGTLSTIRTIGNFGDYQLFNLAADYHITLAKYWRLDANASLFHDRFTSVYLGKEIGNSLFGFDLDVGNSFLLHPNLTLELLQRYQSKRLRLAEFDFGRYRADAVINYGLFGGKAKLKLAVTDIFYTYLDKGYSQFDKLRSSFAVSNENRRFHLGISYVFGRKGQAKNLVVPNEDLNKRIQSKNESYQSRKIQNLNHNE